MGGPINMFSSLKAEAVGDWEACGEYFYCKEHLYDMNWQDNKLEQKRICCARFGGPIATVRDDSKMVVVKGASTRPIFCIFTAGGTEVGTFLWEKGRIAGMGWTAEEQLVVVEDNGKVTMYSMHGERLPREFSFGGEVEAQGVADCCFYDDGIVVLTGLHRLWSVTSFADPRPHRLADAQLKERPLCMTVIEPRFSLSSGIEVLLGTPAGIIEVDDQTAITHSVKSTAAVCHIAVSPDGHFIACFTRDGRLAVLSSDLSKRLSEVDTKSDTPPQRIAWCGADAVVLLWPELMLVVGPYGDWVRYPIEELPVMVSEVDGLRLITDTRQELLRRVADSSVDVFRPGSTSPGAQLWEARELFDSRSARADKMLREVRGSLQEAVEACVSAAAADISIPRQRALLRAAVYGRAFCAPFPPLRLHDTCRRLRILNAVRDPAVGMPITMAQLEALTLPVLIARLVNAHHHLLAHRIAGMLGVGQERVLLHWACAKISASSNVPDQELKELLTTKLRGAPNIRFAAIAAHAQALGRRRLAIKLLDEEPSSAEQVPLLLSLHRSGAATAGRGEDGAEGGGEGEEDTLGRALRKATESGDADLVYLVIFHILKHKSLTEFWALASNRPLARNLFYKYCRARDPELLEQTFTLMGMHPDLAELHLQRALGDLAQTMGGAAEAATSSSSSSSRGDEVANNKFTAALGDVSQKYAQSKEHAFQSKAVAEWATLRREQAKLERDTGQALFLGLPLVDTIRTCIRLGNHKAAAHFKKLFAVSDRRFYWIKIRTLAEAKDWEGLDAFAAERKSPVGWEPFLEAAKKCNAPREYQARIIVRMPDSKQKAEEYVAIEHQREAAEVAAKLRDGDLLAKIQGAVSANSPVGLAIAQIRDRFQSSFRQH